MKTRDDMVNKLRASDLYKQAMARARDDNERRAIAQLVEGFVGSVADVLLPVTERVRTDKLFAEQLGRALAEGKDVLSSSEPAVTGSAH